MYSHALKESKIKTLIPKLDLLKLLIALHFFLSNFIKEVIVNLDKFAIFTVIFENV